MGDMRASTRSVLFAGFAGGLGWKNHESGDNGYGITLNAITRFGGLLNGLKEVAEPTGIAAGFRGIKQIKHNDVNIRITWNGTDSKIYRIEAAVWALKETVVNARCWDVVSFHDGTNSILAVAYGADAAFRYSTDDGGTWTASTFAGTSDNPKYFLNQQNNLSAPRVLWIVDPNQLYFATSLINGTTVSTSSTIAGAGAQEYFTGIVQNNIGVVYTGKRHRLYAYANGPSVVVAGPYNDPIAEAGGQSDRYNFENPQVMSNGWIIFQVEGVDLKAVRDRDIQTQLAPRWTPQKNGWMLPRLELPINCMQVVGDNLVVALGIGDTTKRSVVSLPGGTTLVQNSFVATSELYTGVMDGDNLVWYGSELTCTSLLRGMFYDEDDGYLYLFSGASESADLQARRCYFLLTAPDVTLVSSNLQMNVTDVAVLETALIGAETPFDREILEYLKCNVLMLASTVPSLRVDYRFVPESDTSTAYVILETYTDPVRALIGTAFPRWATSTMGRLQLRLAADSTSTPDRFGKLISAELMIGTFAARRLPVGAL